MTDIRDITSTSNTTQNMHGRTIHTVRDSLLVELMLSVIAALTVLSCMTILKAYILIIDVSMYPTFSVLIVALIHTVIRRFKTDKMVPVIILHIMVSVLFFRVATLIPALEFGNRTANRLYLAVILIALTLFSIIYRSKPSFSAGDKQVILSSGGLQLIAFILCLISGRKELSEYVMFNAMTIVIVYIIMRQIAVFDSKYYHSIHKISRSSSLLKKQNNKTVAILIGIIALTLAVLKIFPYSVLSSLATLIAKGLKAFLGLFSFLFDKEPEIRMEEEADTPQMNQFNDTGEYNSFIGVLAKAVIVLLFVAFIIFACYTVSMLIMNAAKYNHVKELADDRLIDTIEDIKPEKKKRKARLTDFGTGYERKVRKRFYDKTRRAMKKGLPVYDSSTPGQIESVLLANGDKDISSLRNEYENIRYGK